MHNVCQGVCCGSVHGMQNRVPASVSGTQAHVPAPSAGCDEGRQAGGWACCAADSCELIQSFTVDCLRQVAVNRSRLKAVVEALLRDMPHQREAAARREEGIEFARQFHNVGLS